MATFYNLNLVASTYGSGTYNGSTYNGTATTGSTSGGTAGRSGGGSLSNTGVAIAGIVTLAALILLVAMAVRIWRRPAKKLATETVESDENQR